jgi:integrase
MSKENIRMIYLAFKERVKLGVGNFGRNRFALRDFCYVRLLIETAGRPGEIIKVRKDDFDLVNRMLVIRPENEKSGRPKYFLLTPSFVLFFDEYLRFYKDWISKRGGHVFFSNKVGGGFLREHHFVWYIYNPLLKRLGLVEHVRWGGRLINRNCLYSIRAGVLTFLSRDKGFSPKEVQCKSQHVNLSTLERFYLKYDMFKVQESLNLAQSELTMPES